MRWGEGVSTRGGEEITSIEQMGGCSPYRLGFPGVREREPGCSGIQVTAVGYPPPAPAAS